MPCCEGLHESTLNPSMGQSSPCQPAYLSRLESEVRLSASFGTHSAMSQRQLLLGRKKSIAGAPQLRLCVVVLGLPSAVPLTLVNLTQTQIRYRFLEHTLQN